MAQPRLRVLVDLSMACRGYCGIAQDVRLLYKTLSLCPDVEVTGLVYRPQKFASPHRFCAAGASRAERIANQASFLWKLSTPQVGWRHPKSIGQLYTIASTLAARRRDWITSNRRASGRLSGGKCSPKHSVPKMFRWCAKGVSCFRT